MPIKKSAMKKLRVDKKRRAKNQSVKSELRTLIKKVESFCLSGAKEKAADIYKKLCVKIDRAASRKIVHKNYAARNKSRLKKKITALKG